ncbi:ABC transporter ATP-binding protein [Candidatus Peregrinibacteria bacterium]|nr:ABC transporter ATP-binding protein [Candidatus Peregrinibacteria bacterium]
MSILKRIAKEVLKAKKTIVLLAILMLLAAGFDISAPFIAQNLIDRLVGAFSVKQVIPLSVVVFAALGIFAATVFSRFFDTLYDYRLFTFVTKLEDDLRFQAYQKYLSLHTLYHHEVNSGQIIGRIDRGASGVYEILRDIIGKFVAQPAFIVLLIAGVLFWKDPIMGALILIPLPIFVAVIVPLAGRIYEKEKKAHDLFEEFNREEYDVAANVLTVKHFSQESRETAKQRIMRAAGRAYQYEAERYWKVSEVLQTAVATVGRVAVIIAGGYFTIIGRSTVGEFVLYVTLQNMAYQPLWQLSVLFAILRRSLARAERLFKVLDVEPKVLDLADAEPLPMLKRAIEFCNVSFSYRKEREVLREISVAIPAGKMVALVGRSGSGKSTFVNLLLRSFDPQSGEICIDGHDISTVTQKSLRDQMAIVSQEVDLFSRTIGENISYGKPDALAHEISQAAKLAYAHDFIMKMPEGYQTMVGERGVKLSGGERQRIGIARAILRNPRILILDEATSHLDTESERMVQRATQHLTEGRTTIVIAHRLSTILHADKILVFDRGRIVGEGRHEELLKSNEIYSRLYRLQFEE